MSLSAWAISVLAQTEGHLGKRNLSPGMSETAVLCWLS